MASRWIRLILALGLVAGILPLSMETGSAQSEFGNAAFERTWARTDLPVAQGNVNRTWMWGPGPRTEAFQEGYQDAPGGTRLVQYTDKSRMEDNAHNASAPWDVTNGLLATELITGRVQLGDSTFDQWQPSGSQVAGDSHPDSPTYMTFNGVLDHEPVPDGWTITQTIDRHGTVGSNSSLGQHGVTAQYHVPATNHTVASVFWTFMNSAGLVYENGQYVQANLFENPFFATGYPITEAYWMNVPVGGQWHDVLAQCFERRCLTYTPGNSAGWQVEAGNIGQHYYQWRYGDMPPTSPPPGPGQNEIEYLEDIAILLEATDISFEAFIFLLENLTLTNEWYDLFDDVMELWHEFYWYLDSLDPPSGYHAFHNKLLDAYWMLGLAADDFILGFYLLDEYWLDQGLIKFEQFADLFDEAFMLLPTGLEDPVFLDVDQLAPTMDVMDEILDRDQWDDVLEQV